MVIYRQFLPALRKLAFEEVHILLHDDISAKMKQYIFTLKNVPYADGGYHYVYGNMKRCIISFIMFFADTIDDVIREKDKYSQTATRKELIRLMETTLEIHERSQAEFLDEYLPVTSSLEQEILDDIEKKYQAFMAEAMVFKENLNRLDKPEKVDAFAKEHFKIAIVQMNKVLNFTHLHLGRMLVDRVDQIKTSLEEIHLRLRNNLKRIYIEYEDIMNNLRDRLYDKNKESMALSRSYRRNSLETAEVTKSIDIIRYKIETYEGLPVTGRLEEEVAYWAKKVAELEKTRSIIVQVKKGKEELAKQEQIYNQLKTTELPGTKHQCFQNMGENFAKRKIYLEGKLEEVARAMMTIFSCRGNDRILYKDNIGTYFMDDFSHQVYIKDHLMEVYHVDCDGGFVKISEEAYFFDGFGRHIKSKIDGTKTYRCAPCTSQYKLMDNGLLGKITKDCGHSERANSKCRVEMQDLTKVEILPMTEPVDIKNTLDPEVVKYLWDCFGAILPPVLRDVGVRQSKNPIHHFAHMLLMHKYEKTRIQLHDQYAEAQKYRADIYKRREDKAIAASKAWKAKQVRRRKPEESDDTMDWQVYQQREAQHEFINSLDYYND